MTSKVIINLAPHLIRLKTDAGVVELPQDGPVARVIMCEQIYRYTNGLPVVTRQACEVVGLPDPVEGKIYLVSSMVLDAVEGRDDVFAPDTGDTAVRKDGQVWAVTRLVGK